MSPLFDWSMHMSLKPFTLAEANALIPIISPLMGQLVQQQAQLAHRYQQLGDVLDRAWQNVASPTTNALVQDFTCIESLVSQIRAHGCRVTDINVGLVDFLTEINGREVFLCWKYGESHITHYHNLESGFAGRQPLPQTLS